MPRITKEAAERRQEILDTAIKLFYEKGYEKTSIADIGRTIGVAQGLCCRYFSPKEMICDTALDQYAEGVSFRATEFDKNMIGEIIVKAVASVFQQSIPAVSTGFSTSIISGTGISAIAAYGITGKLEIILLYYCADAAGMDFEEFWIWPGWNLDGSFNRPYRCGGGCWKQGVKDSGEGVRFLLI